MSFYNLQVLRGLGSNRSMLSCTPSGGVDLWKEDDASGRQRWELKRIQGIEGNVFNILVQGGTDLGKKFLSCTSDGQRVDLWEKDDGSGRQRWALTQAPSEPGIPAYFHLKPIAGVSSDRTFLSCAADGQAVDLWREDDGSGRQRWQLQGPALP
jgi:hypothetical protein